ncbi:proliferating cell nuclear antigen (pcna) [Candidatus Micrarchaeota archaeon]|nr:proliferating cell nuclear antigen (pcna) [Candidatus Micrarchaeota archaeon]
MELVITDAKEFKQAIDAIVNLVDEGTFEVTSDGLKLRSMDPSQIAMVDFSLPKNAFTELNTEGNASITLNLVDFTKVLSSASSGEKLSIKLDEKENRLLLDFTGKSKRSFKLPLLESSANTPREPKIEFDTKLKIKGGALKGMLRDAGLLSSHVILQADDAEFLVEANGDSGDLRVETKKNSEIVVELDIKNKSRAMFPFEYLEDMTRSCTEDNVLTLEMKTDAPVKVSYEVGKAKLCYYLAPRVENA